MHHHLTVCRRNLHGHFSRDLASVLEIEPGDTVRFECLDAAWSIEPPNGKDWDHARFPDQDPVLDDGHALTGPVYVRGAEPGMTLAVRVDALRVGDWGVTLAGGWPCEWNDALGVTEHGIFRTWRFDEAREWATNSLGFRVPLRPFLGVMGMPSADSGIHSTVPPRATGGNIDCKELVVGSTLYLPISVPGGLFSTGDGHGAQGDGEVSVTAIEVPMTADLTIDLVENMPISAPIANTPAGWVTMGFDADLTQATVSALNSMLDLLGRQYGLSRLDALALASVCVDMRITQMVNQVRGVHAVLPHGALSRVSEQGNLPLTRQ